jgi:hypothetical protein
MTPRLGSVTKRLQVALARIDRAVETRAAEAEATGDEGARRLAADLAAARTENSELAAANVSVAARLDHAIDRLRAVLRA